MWEKCTRDGMGAAVLALSEPYISEDEMLHIVARLK